MGVVRQFVGHVMPGVMRPLRVLWNEVIGFLFFVLAVWATPTVIRSVRQLDEPEGSIFRVAVSAGFAVVMVYFAITSFLRARRISRSGPPAASRS